MMATVRVLSVMEATTVTGPVKNLLSFSRLVRSSRFQGGMGPRVDLSIATFQRSPGPDDPPNAFLDAARADGVEVDVIRERFRFDPGVIRELSRIVHRRAPHIIQTHMVKSHFLVKLSGLWRRYVWVAYHHGYTTTDWKMLAYNQLNRWSLPSATRVVAVCVPFAAELSRAGVAADRITVCHNSVAAPAPVGQREREALRATLGVAEDERLVLAVGRLSREKGHVDLVRALAILRGLNVELKWKLAIVGEGPERRRIERVARAEGVDRRVVFAGHTGNVWPYYAIADLLALPSHSEGSPNVLLEAMAAGLPVVAAAVGGVPELAAHEKSALLVPPGDVTAFAAALNRLLTDVPLARRLGAAAARATVGFSPEAYASSLVNIYRQLVPGARVPAGLRTRSG